MRNLGFRYAEGEAWVVRHLNLDIAAGESVAIAGPSGMGKTTLATRVRQFAPGKGRFRGAA
ncbi:ATP-binding cassette domain-containing protein [Metallibacterium scheffleri]|uniref:ABC transporter domain-containing protein n=1 Tax=Metallibacterium scheffleri TaxID=993689 RepID=A0A4S3KQF1_9GAMM|nr:ATP-binding cassette domain-containing protein [Metallibacterium scheffleri]THD11277.1 hypothetical protein B1806_03935 [Metallibacterium scheffleri]